MDPNDDFQAGLAVETGPRTYIYHPLAKDHIRLLSIHDLEDKGMVNCSIQEVAIDENKEYCALSYRWGDPSSDDPWILINGYSLQIGRNLFKFLCRAGSTRYSDSRKRPLFWIDALCIDQRSTRERTEQVRFMDKIYKRAHQVLIWLGDEEIYNSKLFSHMRVGRDNKANEYDKSSRAQYKKICNSKYWSRMWVVQEIQCAAKDRLCIMCGPQLIHWNDFFATAATGFEVFSLDKKPIGKHVDHAKNSSSPGDAHLFELIARYAACECAMNRDRVVALLSLSAGNVMSGDLYSGTDADFALRCCKFYNGDLEAMARLMKTLHIKPQVLRKEIRTWQSKLNRDHIPGYTRHHAVILKLSYGEFTKTNVIGRYECKHCMHSTKYPPAPLFGLCTVFCLGWNCDNAHLVYMGVHPHLTTGGASMLFVPDSNKNIWHGLNFLQDRHCRQRRPNRPLLGGISDKSVPSETSAFNLSSSICKGPFMWKTASPGQAEVCMALELFACLTQYAESNTDARFPYLTKWEAQPSDFCVIRVPPGRAEASFVKIVDSTGEQQASPRVEAPHTEMTGSSHQTQLEDKSAE